MNGRDTKQVSQMFVERGYTMTGTIICSTS